MEMLQFRLICNAIPTIKPLPCSWENTVNFLHAVVCLFHIIGVHLHVFLAEMLEYGVNMTLRNQSLAVRIVAIELNWIKVTCSLMKCPAMNCRMKCCLRSNESLIFSL
jgi:hypothetical protein